jgi:RNA polymerase sigma-70 factor (ECF subfamily)
MPNPEATCWTLIRHAAEGMPQDREQFALCYEPVVRAYLAKRWRGTSHLEDLGDAVQEVFVECFKTGGVLGRVDPQYQAGFRGFLFGAVRNVALRFESRNNKRPAPLPAGELPESEASLSQDLDRAWANALLREAALRQAAHADREGARAQKRVELLRLRFHDDLPIRVIAQRWEVDAAVLHHEYARAREEFRAALREVVALHHPGTDAEIDGVCANLLAAVT